MIEILNTNCQPGDPLVPGRFRPQLLARAADKGRRIVGIVRVKKADHFAGRGCQPGPPGQLDRAMVDDHRTDTRRKVNWLAAIEHTHDFRPPFLRDRRSDRIAHPAVVARPTGDDDRGIDRLGPCWQSLIETGRTDIQFIDCEA